MARSRRVRASDVMKSMQILGECREFGADRDRWTVHLIEQIRDLLGSQVVISSEMLGLGRGEPTESVGLFRVGWPSERAEMMWREYAANVPLERKPEYPVVSKLFSDVETRGATLTRDAIWGGREVWNRSRAFNDVHRACGIDDYIFSIRRLPRTRTVSSLWVHRAVGDPPFQPRERRLLSLLHDQVAPLIGIALASGTEPGLAALPPRPRQVLGLLLEGLSEQDVADRLDLSKATVHEHASRVYRHFGVSSRPELLARFVGRSPPPAPDGH